MALSVGNCFTYLGAKLDQLQGVYPTATPMLILFSSALLYTSTTLHLLYKSYSAAGT